MTTGDKESQVNEEIGRIIDESVRLELNVSNLYRIFQRAFPEDSAFWAELVLEEQHHASLIQDVRHELMSDNDFAREFLAPKLELIEEMNVKLSAMLEEFSKAPPSRNTAFNVAHKLEESAGEAHFQSAMLKPEPSKTLMVLQVLNLDDKNHADRICAYMNEKGIEMKG
jgi:hypothetical protein